MLLKHKKRRFPFTAIVGQEMMKEALLLNAVDPSIGGVLIRGKKGSAKSTASRALGNVLGDDVPFVTLPLNATEDMVIGGIDIDVALKDGRRKCSPGLLHKAHKGILYIDEVNLLNSHLVEILLDVTASGINIVEREGISCAHLSEFIIIGTMNPEEGEIGPQLLDRFGLSVQVDNEKDIANRALIIKQREAFDRNPQLFISGFEGKEAELKDKIQKAKMALKEVMLGDNHLALIVEIVKENNCAGHRAEIIMAKTARAIAAFSGRDTVTTEDIQRAARFVLPHRMRENNDPNPPPPADNKEKNQPGTRQNENKKKNKEDNRDNGSPQRNTEKNGHDRFDAGVAPLPQPEINFEIGRTFPVRRIDSTKDRIFRKGSGRRSRTKTRQKMGRYVKSVLHNQNNDIALDATLRAAAPYQKARIRDNRTHIVVKAPDMRWKVREKKYGNYLLFVVDASGSMGAYRRMTETKGAIMSLLMDAYQKRDKVGMIAFRRDKAQCLLTPTNSIELAGKLLKELVVGGKTPLSCALALTYDTLRAEMVKNPTVKPIVIFITDGKANRSLYGADPVKESLDYSFRLASSFHSAKYVVIDTEAQGNITLGLAKTFARSLNAEYYRMADVAADTITRITRGIINSQE